MKLCCIVGTRPEFVKMSSIIKGCEKQHLDYFVIHTGQHYSQNMDGVFFEQLELPKPKYNLGVGSGSIAVQLPKMLPKIIDILLEEKPSLVLVEGDTYSALSGALAAQKCGILVGHVEAGLRSYFDGMPEEINRVIIDHHSDLLFAPTEKAKQTLIEEGLPQSRVFVTGNTVIDALYEYLPKARKENCDCGSYILATIHRQENTDDKERFKSIIQGLGLVSEELNIPVIYPIHPRARKRMVEYGFEENGIRYTEPMDYFTFLWMEEHARLILTDSGGVQEESCVLHTPCVTLRDNTERMETVEVGANMLAGTDPAKILECSKIMCSRGNDWRQPFGNGKAGENILDIVRRTCG